MWNLKGDYVIQTIYVFLSNNEEADFLGMPASCGFVKLSFAQAKTAVTF